MRSIRAFLEIHSIIDYVATPPSGWLWPALDLGKTVDSIYSKVENDEYLNEYDMQLDLWMLARLSHDDHYAISGDLMGIFSFYRQMSSLISLSEDGIEIPAVYLFCKYDLSTTLLNDMLYQNPARAR